MTVIVTVPQSHCMIVERFGKPVKVAEAGFHFFLLGLFGIDKAKDVSESFTFDGRERTFKKGVFIELTEQTIDTQPRSYITKDNIEMSVNCVLRWRITDPIKAVYEVDHLHQALIETTLSEVRSYVGAHELNHILSNRQSISEHMNATLAETARRWGVNVVGVEIQELRTDDATLDAMRQQLEASRKAEALKLLADGEAEAVVKKAKADAEALLIRAQSESDYLKMLNDSVGREGAMKIILANKILDAYKTIANEPAHKVFIATPERMGMMMNNVVDDVSSGEQ